MHDQAERLHCTITTAYQSSRYVPAGRSSMIRVAVIFERERETQVKTAYVVQAVCGDGRPV